MSIKTFQDFVKDKKEPTKKPNQVPYRGDEKANDSNIKAELEQGMTDAAIQQKGDTE